MGVGVAPHELLKVKNMQVKYLKFKNETIIKVPFRRKS